MRVGLFRWSFSIVSSALLLAAGGQSARAAVTLFSDALNDASANISIQADGDTATTFVDYSNFSVAGTNFTIAEAPNSVAGGTATRGLLMQANIAGGAAAAINAVVGSNPITFSGNYTFSYDVYMNSTLAVGGGGTTEQTLFGIGTDGAGSLEARSDRPGGIGTWGWLASENGYGTEDTAIYTNGTNLENKSDGNAAALFNAAFTNVYATTNAAPGGQWVNVEVEALNGNVVVRYNGVEFFNVASAATDGFAMFGYEDAFGSVADPTSQSWALYDNIVVSAVPEPGALSLGLFALGCLSLRRRRV